MQFNIGDRVRYAGKDKRCWPNGVVLEQGAEGEVRKVDSGEAKSYYTILFDGEARISGIYNDDGADLELADRNDPRVRVAQLEDEVSILKAVREAADVRDSARIYELENELDEVTQGYRSHLRSSIAGRTDYRRQLESEVERQSGENERLRKQLRESKAELEQSQQSNGDLWDEYRRINQQVMAVGNVRDELDGRIYDLEAQLEKATQRANDYESLLRVDREDLRFNRDYVKDLEANLKRADAKVLFAAGQAGKYQAQSTDAESLWQQSKLEVERLKRAQNNLVKQCRLWKKRAKTEAKRADKLASSFDTASPYTVVPCPSISWSSPAFSVGGKDYSTVVDSVRCSTLAENTTLGKTERSWNRTLLQSPKKFISGPAWDAIREISPTPIEELQELIAYQVELLHRAGITRQVSSKERCDSFGGKHNQP